jgi:hypothetical protein
MISGSSFGGAVGLPFDTSALPVSGPAVAGFPFTLTAVQKALPGSNTTLMTPVSTEMRVSSCPKARVVFAPDFTFVPYSSV